MSSFIKKRTDVFSLLCRAITLANAELCIMSSLKCNKPQFGILSILYWAMACLCRTNYNEYRTVDVNEISIMYTGKIVGVPDRDRVCATRLRLYQGRYT